MTRAPGVYLGLSNEEYHDDPAVGSTGIKMLIERPYRYWFASPLNPNRPPKAPTKPMKFGTAYHTLILEPDLFDYKIKFGVDQSQIAGTLGEGEWNRMQAMQQRLFANPRRAALLSEGVSEVSLFWVDKETGVTCKCRFDKFAPDWILDLKTAASITDAALFHAIPDLGYDVSGAMYSIGARALKDMIQNGYKMPPQFSNDFISRFMAHSNQIFAFLMQEKEAPYLVRCLLLAPDIAACGRDKFRAGLTAYKRYQSQGWATDDYAAIEDMEMDKYSNRINLF